MRSKFWASRAGNEQGLHVRASRHLRVRWVKALAQFSLQDQRARNNKGVFQGRGLAQRNIEKRVAEIGPRGFVLAAERWRAGVCRGDHERIRIGEGRYEDARIASRNDHDLISHAGSLEHLGELGWLERFSQSPPRGDGEAVGRAMRREDDEQNVALAVHLFCFALQRCRKRVDGRIPARLGIEFYDGRASSKSARHDLCRASRLAAKNTLIAIQSE